jgi:sugar (pentulose or hexulose) kinase
MSSTIYTAAVDFGATSGRVILGSWSKNKLTLNEVHRFPNTFRTLAGHDYWDLGTLWHEAQTGLRKAVAALPRGAGGVAAAAAHSAPLVVVVEDFASSMRFINKASPYEYKISSLPAKAERVMAY